MGRVQARLGSLLNNRWLVFVAAMWMQAVAGIGYLFGSLSPVIKSALGYNQREIARLGVAKDLGDSIDFLAGSLCEILPLWAALLVGVLQNFVPQCCDKMRPSPASALVTTPQVTSILMLQSFIFPTFGRALNFAVNSSAAAPFGGEAPDPRRASGIAIVFRDPWSNPGVSPAAISAPLLTATSAARPPAS